MIRDIFSPDGPLNVPEYGDLKTEQGFKNLLEISAYYHVKDAVKYPAVMLTAGMNAPRVVPWEPAKWPRAFKQQPLMASPSYCVLNIKVTTSGLPAKYSQVRP
jgi:prolyl oligopeptidase